MLRKWINVCDPYSVWRGQKSNFVSVLYLQHTHLKFTLEKHSPSLYFGNLPIFFHTQIEQYRLFQMDQSGLPCSRFFL